MFLLLVTIYNSNKYYGYELKSHVHILTGIVCTVVSSKYRMALHAHTHTHTHTHMHTLTCTHSHAHTHTPQTLK